MQRIFTLVLSLVFSAWTQLANSQTCSVAANCPPTVEDFSDNASGFTGSVFSYDATDDQFEGLIAREAAGSVGSNIHRQS